MKAHIEWLVFSIGGLVLVGAGISIVGDAIARRIAGDPWFWVGTVGLVVLNSGLSCFGRGVIARVRHLREKP